MILIRLKNNTWPLRRANSTNAEKKKVKTPPKYHQWENIANVNHLVNILRGFLIQIYRWGGGRKGERLKVCLKYLSWGGRFQVHSTQAASTSDTASMRLTFPAERHSIQVHDRKFYNRDCTFLRWTFKKMPFCVLFQGPKWRRWKDDH